MTSPMTGPSPINPDSRHSREDRSDKKRDSSERVEEAAKKILDRKDEYIPSNDLACEIVNYSKDASLRKIICHRRYATDPPAETLPTQDPPTDLEFEKI